MKKALVTGARSQLAQCIKDQAQAFDNLQLDFVDRQIFDLSQPQQMDAYLKEHSYDYCINTAAYTLVEAAESDKDQAFAINFDGVRALAELCDEHGITLIHISTDYVFDGEQQRPYTEGDKTNPINVYGTSKLAGEQAIAQAMEAYYILRTSWLYSQYGHNFYKSIQKWAKDKQELTITTEQTGTPTNANDLASAVLLLIEKDPHKYGIYHYSNGGQATWYDFAEAILALSGQLTEVKLVKTDHYPTFAARPKYSVLDCSKYQALELHPISDWRIGLKKLIYSKV